MSRYAKSSVLIFIFVIIAAQLNAFSQIPPQQKTAKDFFEEGVRLHAKGENEKAIEAYREAIRLDNKYFEAHVNLGVILAVLKRYDDAISAVQEATRIRPNEARAYHLLGRLYVDAGNAMEAENAFKEALRLDPDFVPAKRDLATLYGFLKRTQEAVNLMLQLIASNETDATLRFFLGNIY